MANDIRKQAELLFRMGNSRVSGGSAGTAWEQLLDNMVKLLGENEKLLHILGFQNFGLRGAPGTLLTVTSRRLIAQLSSEVEAFSIPLETVEEVAHRKNFLFQSYTYIRSIYGFEFKFDTPKDVTNPLIQALNTVQEALQDNLEADLEDDQM